jgi:hypothetical protein
LALQWMQEYLRIDTTNPPGNEMRAAAFFKKILDQEGSENSVTEFSSTRPVGPTFGHDCRVPTQERRNDLLFC